jgi:hypothetical protein
MIAKDKITAARALSLALKSGYFYIYNPVFTRNLSLGMTGSDVISLKRVLNTDETTALSYADGSIFGPKPELYDQETFIAVKKFQEKYADEILKPNKLTEGTGNVGPSTRAKLNKIEFEIEIRAYAIRNNIPLKNLAPDLVDGGAASSSAGGATGSAANEDKAIQIKNLVNSIFSGNGNTGAMSVYNAFNYNNANTEDTTNSLQVQVMSSNYSPSPDNLTDGSSSIGSNPYYYNNSSNSTVNNYWGSSTPTQISTSGGGDSGSSGKYTFGGKIVDVRYCGSTGDIAASIEESKDNGSTTVNIYFFDSGESAAKGMSVMGYASQSLTFCATCKNNGKYGCYKNGKKVIAYYYTK